MLDIKQIIIDLLTTVLAGGIGLVVFSKLNTFHRFVFFQVIVYLGIDIAAVMFREYNTTLFNMLMAVETILLIKAGSSAINSKNVSRIYFGLYAIFFCIYLYDVLVVKSFAYHGAIAQGLLMTLLFLHVLFDQFSVKERSVSIILTSIGLILYFACTIPYLGLIFYLNKSNPSLNQTLFQYIIVGLASVRYLLIAIAFFFTGIKASPNK